MVLDHLNTGRGQSAGLVVWNVMSRSSQLLAASIKKHWNRRFLRFLASKFDHHAPSDASHTIEWRQSAAPQAKIQAIPNKSNWKKRSISTNISLSAQILLVSLNVIHEHLFICLYCNITRETISATDFYKSESTSQKNITFSSSHKTKPHLIKQVELVQWEYSNPGHRQWSPIYWGPHQLCRRTLVHQCLWETPANKCTKGPSVRSRLHSGKHPHVSPCPKNWKQRARHKADRRSNSFMRWFLLSDAWYQAPEKGRWGQVFHELLSPCGLAD